MRVLLLAILLVFISGCAGPTKTFKLLNTANEDEATVHLIRGRLNLLSAYNMDIKFNGEEVAYLADNENTSFSMPEGEYSIEMRMTGTEPLDEIFTLARGQTYYFFFQIKRKVHRHPWYDVNSKVSLLSAAAGKKIIAEQR